MNGILDVKGDNDNPLTEKPYSDSYAVYAMSWSRLPAYKNALESIKLLQNNDVILIRSDTGSGKTVLFPKFALHILNYKRGVIVSLPKRIITKSAAEYASKLLDVKLGEHVGYRYKGASMHSEDTRLLFCSDGSLTTYLISCILDLDNFVYSIIIIDEVHERKIQTDFNIYLCKTLLKLCKSKNKFCKLIFMSADVDVGLYTSYFKDYKFHELHISNPPIYSVRTLETKSNSINDILEKQTKSSDNVLIFLPSIRELHKLESELSSAAIQNRQLFKLYADAPDMATFGQHDGTKIIISTNVAESSLTIPGLDVVIDSGLEYIKTYEPNTNVYQMTKKYISKAQVVQRKGRIGRTSDGTYIPIYDTSSIRSPYGIASIEYENIGPMILSLVRTLKQSISTSKSMRELITAVLKHFMVVPSDDRIKSHLDHLEAMGYIYDSELNPMVDSIVFDLPFSLEELLCIPVAYDSNKLFDILVLFMLTNAIKNDLSVLIKDETALKKIEKSNSVHTKLIDIIKKYKKKKQVPEYINVKHIKNAINNTHAYLSRLIEYFKLRKSPKSRSFLQVLKTGLKYNTYKIPLKATHDYICNEATYNYNRKQYSLNIHSKVK